MEIEAKFELVRADTGELLATASDLGSFRLGPIESLNVTDQYLDTARSDFLRQHFECRLRTSEHGTFATLKAIEVASDRDSAETFTREEIEQQLPSAALNPDEWPAGPARERVLQLSEGRPLQAVLSLHQQRLTRQVLDGARAVGELSVDRVRAEHVDAAEGTFAVVEVELGAEGTIDDLRRIAAELANLPGLTPATESKFERGLALLRDAATPPDATVPRVSGQLSMPEAGALVIDRYWKHARRQVDAVLLGEEHDAIHDMRVAVRRTRSACSLFADWYPDAEIGRLRRELRRLGRRLGDARDLEVLIAGARAAVAGLADARLDGLLAYWDERHTAARVRVLDYLRSGRFSRFEQRFDHFLKPFLDEGVLRGSGGTGAKAAERRQVGRSVLTCDVMPGRIWDRYGDIHAYVANVSVASPAELHRLRIAGKRLRYTIEAFEEALSPRSSRVVSPLKRLQDILGDLHDADVCIDMLESFQKSHAGPQDRIEPYLELKRSDLLAARARFEELWPRISSDSLRRDLSAALSTLWEGTD